MRSEKIFIPDRSGGLEYIMMNDFFSNLNFNAEDEIATRDLMKTVCETYGKTADSMTDADRAAVQKTISGAVDILNREVKHSAVMAVCWENGAFLPAVDIFRRMSYIEIDIPENAKDSEKVRAVRFATSYRVWKITFTSDAGKSHKVIFSGKTLKAISFSDILSEMIDSLAAKHADRQPTKADRETARGMLFTLDVSDVLRAFIAAAVQYFGLIEKVNFKSLSETVYRFADKEGKNVFEKISKTGAGEQIRAMNEIILSGGISYRKNDAASLYHRAVMVDRDMRVKTATIDALLYDFVIMTRCAFNQISYNLVDRAEVTEKTTAESGNEYFIS